MTFEISASKFNDNPEYVYPQVPILNIVDSSVDTDIASEFGCQEVRRFRFVGCRHEANFENQVHAAVDGFQAGS